MVWCCGLEVQTGEDGSNEFRWPITEPKKVGLCQEWEHDPTGMIISSSVYFGGIALIPVPTFVTQPFICDRFKTQLSIDSMMRNLIRQR